MKTTFYTRNEANIENVNIPAGYPIATLETPDGIDVKRVINALANGFVTTDKPKEPAGDLTVRGVAHPLRPAPVIPAAPEIAPA